jgi:predicted acetyltransferase
MIREVNNGELDEFARITIEAFPGMKIVSQDDRGRMIQRLAHAMSHPAVHFFAAFEGEQMVGVIRCYDFSMKLHDRRVLVGGLGGVAVDLRYKKERVAADMVRYYLDYYREKQAALLALYPFRPDFYHRMGFGHGVKMNRYSFRPDALPAAGPKIRLSYLTAGHQEAIAACYDRFMERTNGLIEPLPFMLEQQLTNPENKVVGYWRDETLCGYAIFRFQPGDDNNWLLNNIELRALIYDDPAALSALLSFFRTQADQVGRIIYETQDDTFHFLLADPRNGSGNLLAGLWHETNTQGTGIMYRVIDVARLFAQLSGYDFGGVTCQLQLTLTDSFLPENAGTYLLHVENGAARLVDSGAADVAVAMDISDFSSLAAGAIDFARLYTYGRATISDAAQAPLVSRLFRAETPPWCLTTF